MSNSSVLEALKEHLKTPGVYQSAISKATGISKSAISQYLNDKYPGDVGALETKIAQYLNLSVQREAVPHTEIGFIETSVVKQVGEILNNCHVGCRLGILTGASGLGKTTGVQRYVEDHSDVIVIYGRPSITLKSLLQELAEKVGVENRGSADNLFRRIAGKLKGSQRMIVIDEAEHLTARVFDTARRFVDQEWAGVGVV
ncbi:AAA family ATPase, partial [bacterium]|nr:AAA family ATPase [bacterium]